MKIDVIIPLYKPGKELFTLLDLLGKQSLPIQNIILMNTEEKYFEQLTYGTDFVHLYQNVKVFHISKKEFDHGRTRHMGVGKSDADVFVMMTQDALPGNAELIEKLTANLKEDVAVAYARQLPKDDCRPEERLSREFNYPAKSCVKRKEDLKTLGIKTFFCSNVCAAYRRDVYDKLGGFVQKAIFNEDMIYAAKAIENGYGIAYEAEAEVIHSHNYSNMQQLHRNFDMGVSQAQHPEIFEKVPSESEGMKLVKKNTKQLMQNKMWWRIPYFYSQCAFKYAGYFLGKHYVKLPQKWVLALASNKEYFTGV